VSLTRKSYSRSVVPVKLANADKALPDVNRLLADTIWFPAVNGSATTGYWLGIPLLQRVPTTAGARLPRA
jgi:hypothetical protein